VKRFPEGFIWGAATSSHQIEGAVDEDGRGESIWDRFATVPGAIVDGSSGAVACDHYHRYPQDIELMRSLRLGAYRFSLAWPRILPNGRGGRIETRGLDFYDRLVDGLLRAGITPYATLYHWDLPQALQDLGGWTARETAKAFLEYTDVVTRRLGDRVKHWITHNEPWCISVLGYAEGQHAPGHKSWLEALQASHHLNLAHGSALPIIRGNARGAEVGITLNLLPIEAASPSDADREASVQLDGSFNRWFLDPLFGRGYPADVIAFHQASGTLPEGPLPFVEPGDLAIIAGEIDFLGVNYYSRAVVRSARIPEAENLPREVVVSDDKTDMDWEVHPEGLLDLLRRIHRDYAVRRMYITENGAAYGTSPSPDGKVHDDKRRAYLHGHLDAARRACEEGIPLGGYFLWSFLDNWEWAHGYAKRFGIVWVDYSTQARVLKESAIWYSEVIRLHGLPEEES
jgi:beta-glucosidase